MVASRNPGPVPDVAIEYLTRKGLKVGFDNQDVWEDEYLRSFTVSGINREDILRDIQMELDKALNLGETYEKFANNIEEAAVNAGWWGVKAGDDTTNKEILSPTRLRTIYDTNIRTARSVGQWSRIERNRKAFPALQYRIGPSEQHRPAHVRWDGMIFPVGHSFWDTHMPPNGFGCKCYVIALTKRRLVDAGGVSELSAEDKRFTMVRSRQTGKIKRVPSGVDPGFANNPGQLTINQQVKGI